MYLKTNAVGNIQINIEYEKHTWTILKCLVEIYGYQ